ncbi:hypothetical protein [Arthrobacter sp. FW306-04-A]|uniref:hypothetical protein n=1 Tax=Arthrobacter sp. FW306-04-A TaxID=2879619 RepID=UPI0037C09B1F
MTDVESALVASGIESRVDMHNRGEHAAPVAVGVHPYLRLGSTSSDDLTLASDSIRAFPLGDDNLPVRSIDVRGTPFDLRGGVPVDSAPTNCAIPGYGPMMGASGSG